MVDFVSEEVCNAKDVIIGKIESSLNDLQQVID